MQIVDDLSGFSDADWCFGFVRKRRSDNGSEKGKVLIVTRNWETLGMLGRWGWREKRGNVCANRESSWSISHWIHSSSVLLGKGPGKYEKSVLVEKSPCLSHWVSEQETHAMLVASEKKGQVKPVWIRTMLSFVGLLVSKLEKSRHEYMQALGNRKGKKRDRKRGWEEGIYRYKKKEKEKK